MNKNSYFYHKKMSLNEHKLVSDSLQQSEHGIKLVNDQNKNSSKKYFTMQIPFKQNLKNMVKYNLITSKP